MDPLAGGALTIKDLGVSSAATARDVATQLPVSLRQSGNDLTLELSGPAPDVPVHAVAIRHNAVREP
jgi:hypothetical protein